MVSLHATVPSYLHTFVLSTFPYLKKGFKPPNAPPTGHVYTTYSALQQDAFANEGEEGEEEVLVGGTPSWVVGAWYFVSFKMTSAWALRPSDLYPAVRSSYDLC